MDRLVEMLEQSLRDYESAGESIRRRPPVVIAGGPDRFRRMTTPMIRIADPGDDRLADYRELRDADLRGTRRLFTVESGTGPRAIPGQRVATQSVLVEAEVAERLHARLEVLGADVPVYVAERGAEGDQRLRLHGGARPRQSPAGPRGSNRWSRCWHAGG